MTRCAGCRVRHLNCDPHSICTECEKSGRECVRLNVRFRHLVCPSETITREDYSKYEFFFDGQQTWIDTTGKVEFVTESDSSTHTSPAQNLESNVIDTVSLGAEPRAILTEQPPSKFMVGSNSHTPTLQASIPDDDPPDYLAATKHVSHNPSGKVFLTNASNFLVQSSKETSRPSATNGSDIESVLPVPGLAGPLKSLHEGKLLQHFVIHLAPWVCTEHR